MSKQIPVSKEARADSPEMDALRDDHTHQVAPDLAYKRLALVNVAFYGFPTEGAHWVLIDTGVFSSASMILRAAESRFGRNARPDAIVLTHGHFDHIGCLEELAQKWDVSIFAHPLEFPFLQGEAAYPPPDPQVGGGMMAALAGFYPRGPIDVGRWLAPLPSDGSIPVMPGWKWIHTPGHTPGHISLWRPYDKALIAGDAFITTRQESAYAVITQEPEIHGPPMYYTQDWDEARSSVQKLAALEPEYIITGHGRAMAGGEMRRALQELADRFEYVAVPKRGKYVERPAGIGSGHEYAPKENAHLHSLQRK
jgi:glyoxylase-like metal-dependent hydrolase (beta-lactamase superfamily II)